MSKTCNTCLQTKLLSEFHKRGDSTRGVRSDCIVCYRLKINTKRVKSNRVLLTEDELKANRKAALRKFRQTDDYKVQHAFRQALRRAQKNNATFKGLSEHDLSHIKAYYETAQMLTREFGTQFHVDHVVPLNGTNVSGLHAPWNLQVMVGSANCSKGNRYES